MTTIKVKRKVKHLSDVVPLLDQETKDLIGVLDAIETMEEGKIQDTYNKIVAFNKHMVYIKFFTENMIQIRPKRMKDYAQLLALLAKKYGYRDRQTTPKASLALIGLYGGIAAYPRIPEKTILDIYPEGSAEFAIKEDNVEALQALMKKGGFNPKENVKVLSDSPIFFAKSFKESQDTQYMVGMGLLHSETVTYPQMMAFYGSLKCLKFAYGNSAFDKNEIARFAAASGNMELIQFLVKQGVSFDRCFAVAMKFHQYEVCDWLLDNYSCDAITPEQTTNAYNDRATYFLLLNKIRATTNCCTKLVPVACRAGNTLLVKYVANHSSADLETIENDWTGMRPLHLACIHGNSELVYFLAKERNVGKAKRNMNGETARQIADKYGYKDCVKILAGR